MSEEQLSAFRAEARAWLEENFPKSLAGRASEILRGELEVADDEDVAEWGRRLGAKGWATPTWPTEYGGGGLSQAEARVLNEEIDYIIPGNDDAIRAIRIFVTKAAEACIEGNQIHQKDLQTRRDDDKNKRDSGPAPGTPRESPGGAGSPKVEVVRAPGEGEGQPSSTPVAHP